MPALSSYYNTIREAAVLLLVSILAAGLANTFGPSRIPWASHIQAEKGRELAATGMGDVPPQEAMRIWRDKAALFVDAREAEFYRQGHIPGAVNVSIDPLGEDIMDQAKKLPKDRLLVVYCSDIACPKSKELADSLKQLGFGQLRVMVEGLEGWVKAGGPVEGRP
jgi:rhodanese-related sulfurtransferase